MIVRGRYECDLCPVSKYQNLTGQPNCERCFEGTFCPPGTTIAPCPAGQYRNLTSFRCEESWRGHFSALGSTLPKECPAGSYADIEGYPECPLCPAGKYQPGRGSLQCLTEPRTVHSSQCIPCAVHHSDRGTVRAAGA